MPRLDHRVQVAGKTFVRTYELEIQPQNGLRISLGPQASFLIEDLTFHVDAARFSCTTEIPTDGTSPLDDVLSYYAGLGYVAST